MSLLNYYRIGRTTLWQGAPFQVVVRTDLPIEALQLQKYDMYPEVDLSISPSETQSIEAEISHYEPDRIPRLPQYLHFFEVPTDNLPTGAYEVQININHNPEVEVPETLWLFNRSQYREMILKENGEGFLPSQPLNAIDTYNLIYRIGWEHFNSYPVRRIREDIYYGLSDRPALTQHFLGSKKSSQEYVTYRTSNDVNRWLNIQPPYLSMPKEIIKRKFSSAPIRWTTRTIFKELEELSIFGIYDFDWEVILTNRLFGINIKCRFLNPLTKAVSKNLQDNECGGLFLLNSNDDLPDFKVDIELGKSFEYLQLHIQYKI